MTVVAVSQGAIIILLARRATNKRVWMLVWRGDTEMTTWVVRGIIAAGLGLMTLAPTVASAHDYPYCLQGRRWGYPGNCQFESFQQCRVTASGTQDDCGI